MKYYVALFLPLFLFQGTSFSQNTTLQVKLNTANPADENELIYNGKAILSSCEPDRYSRIGEDLTFKFENLEEDSFHLQIFPYSYYKRIDYTVDISSGDSLIEANLEYAYNCPYDKNKDSTICPVCKKSDKVVPIVYHYSSSRKVYSKPFCLRFECEPNWYCKRDKLEF